MNLDLSRPVVGASFTWTIKLAASALLSWLAVLAWHPQVRTGYEGMSLAGQLMMIGCLILLLACYVFVMVGKTTLDAQGIRQSWLWPKRMQWSEAMSARFIGMPFLTWLFPPRLMLKKANGSYTIFNGGTAELHRLFAEVTMAVQRRAFETKAEELRKK